MRILTLFYLRSTQGWLGAFWLKKALWTFRCSNGLCHAIIYVLVTPWRKNYIFGLFRVWHTKWGRTKYDINIIYTLWGFTFPIYCWVIPSRRWQCLFTFPLYVITLCMIYVHLYMLVCGWSCTLYDGPLWLREWPSLAMSAHDLVIWVCAQGNCCRCIFILYCVHNHRGVTVPIHVTKWY